MRIEAKRAAPLRKSRLILFNKPYGVLSQFGAPADGRQHPTLATYIDIPAIYPAGRLDRDSEGLLLLTDDGRLQARIADPRFKLPKTYLVQVEGEPGDDVLAAWRAGVMLKDGMTRPALATRIDPPGLWPRDPPIRMRKMITDSWLSLTISEGRNRQVRRMTAALGFPTLRLVRWAIGPLTLDGVMPGDWRDVPVDSFRMSGHSSSSTGSSSSVSSASSASLSSA
jgi:23S rRNA pseudouridine2457 synthase